MEAPQDKYLREHCSFKEDAALEWIEKQTNIHTNYPRMLSGKVQGSFLDILCTLSGAKRALEIGTFTGYSAVCIARGLGQGGHLDALEINDELEDLIRAGWEKAGVQDRITLHLGDARKTLQILIESGVQPYDIAFVDANKREYREYYEMVLSMLRPGGLIVIDDVLWDGKVYAEKPDCDKQTQSLISFNDFVASDARVKSVMLPLRDGITLAVKL